MNAATAFAQVLVDALSHNGIEHLALAPGSRSAPLALAAHAHPDVTVHVRIDERSAAFLALGLARGAGNGAVAGVVCTSGTAAANLYPAVLEADAAGVPLVVLTADRPPELRGTGANQTVDQLKLYGAAVRWFCEVGVPEPRPGSVAYWRSLATRAAAEAGGRPGGRPGPVHLNCPLREPLVDDDPRPFVEPLGGASRLIAPALDEPDAPRGAATAWDAPAGAQAVRPWAGALLEGVTRGLVVAGDGGAGADRLAQALGWPLIAEPHSGARRGPNALTAGHTLLAETAFAERHRPQAVLVVGRPSLSRAVLAAIAAAPRHVVLAGSGGWPDPTRTAAAVIPADADAFLAAVSAMHHGDVSDGAEADRWLAAWRAADRAAVAAIDAVLDHDTSPSEPRTARDVAAGLADGATGDATATLVVASSRPLRDLDLTLRPSRITVLANRGASGIDGFVSTAVGVALTAAGPVTALAGDLSVLHDANGLLVGPHEPRRPLVIVVVNNDGGGIFSQLPYAGHPAFERLFGTPHGVDFADLARLHGCGFTHVDHAAGLGPALAAAHAAAVAGASGGHRVHLVEVMTDRTATADLHRRLQEAVGGALG